MLINGATVANEEGTDEIIERVTGLPSAFEKKEYIQISFAPEVKALRDKAQKTFCELSGKQDSTASMRILDEAVALFKEVKNIAEDDVEKAVISLDLGFCYRYKKSELEEYIPDLEDALSVLEKISGGEYGTIILSGISTLYMAIRHALSHETLGFDRRKELETKLRKVTKLAYRNYPRIGDVPINPLAHAIPQKGVGFTDSNNDLIGTWNVIDCVCILIRDSVPPHKTALVHVDEGISEGSIEKIVARLSTSGQRLEAKLIGARGGTVVAGANLRKTIEALRKHDVDILAANIPTVDQPYAFTVNAATFSVTDEAPGIYNFNTIIVDPLNMITKETTPLHLVCDLTSSDIETHVPQSILLSSHQINSFRPFMSASVEEIIDACLEKWGPWQAACTHEAMLVLRDRYQEAVAYIQKTFDDKLLEVSKTNYVENISSASAVRALINEHEILIGENADIANHQFVDFIHNRLFVPGTIGSYRMDLDGLSRFRLVEPFTEQLLARISDTEHLTASKLDAIHAFINVNEMPREADRQSVLAAIAESPVDNASQLSAVAQHADVTATTLHIILERINALPDPQDRSDVLDAILRPKSTRPDPEHLSDVLVAVAKSEKVSEAQLERIASYVNSDVMPDIEHRRAVVTSVLSNEKCTKTLRDEFQPFGIYNAENQATELSNLELPQDFVKGSWNKVRKAMRSVAAADVIQLGSEELAALTERYGGRRISENAKIAAVGCRVEGIAIGRNSTGDYLVEIPTSPLTRVKFRWVPRHLAAGESITLNQKVNFQAGHARVVNQEQRRQRASAF